MNGAKHRERGIFISPTNALQAAACKSVLTTPYFPAYIWGES